MFCNLNDPPFIVYNAVEELVALSLYINIPKTKAQIFTIAVEMIRMSRYFKIGLS